LVVLCEGLGELRAVYAAGRRSRWRRVMNRLAHAQVTSRRRPDETTVCRFRHLLGEHDLGRRLFDEVQRHLAAKG